MIRQVRDAGASPAMTVEIESSSITGGTCGALFDNDRGTLRITGLQVSDVKAASLIATANTGTSFLDQSTISRKYESPKSEIAFHSTAVFLQDSIL